MPASPYKALTWGDEPVYTDKLNQMVNNDQWIYENMPRVNFSTYGIKRTNGIKVLAGIAIAPAALSVNSKTTYNFGTFFSSGCKPVIVTGTQPTSGRGRYHVVFRGIGTPYPDHRGMEVTASTDELVAKNNVMDARVYVHFVAIGW